MKKILGVAIGTVHKWDDSKNRNELVSILRNFDIDGVELTLPRKDELLNFKLSEENRDFLRSLDYVSIHAPALLMSFSKNEEDILNQLQILQDLYKDVGAQNIIFHPNELPPPEILKNFGFFVSVENLFKKRDFSNSELKEFFKKYPDTALCIDVCHSFSYDRFENVRLVENFKERISQIHFSVFEDGRDHLPSKHANSDFLLSLEPLLHLNIPVIIEETLEEKNESFLQKEIAEVKRIFAF